MVADRRRTGFGDMAGSQLETPLVRVCDNYTSFNIHERRNCGNNETRASFLWMLRHGLSDAIPRHQPLDHPFDGRSPYGRGLLVLLPHDAHATTKAL